MRGLLLERDDILTRARDAAELFEAIIEDRALLAGLDADLRKRLLMAAGRACRPSGSERSQLKKAQREKDRVVQREAPASC